MGTLFDQSPRNCHQVDKVDVVRLVETYDEVARHYGIPFDSVIKVAELLQRTRELDLRVADNDAKDEQLGGFGEILQEYLHSLSLKGAQSEEL